MSYRTIGSLLLRRLSVSHAPLPKPQHGEAADVGRYKEMVYEMHKVLSILAIGFLFGAFGAQSAVALDATAELGHSITS